ncbi:uncharacterized protein EI90DRAFT_349826 [Cantharellus anzutake]|uniref:uncharacterized protein n=1 Tax=Cantharellus anzutake TaxID=1750568 RepID=UPI00190756B4|nr:uncharacterized protein EI90DRAFT_349826 [Cantharellus anzutake]KAF8315281.1 hypothetical protein EI90DRAFT_349826 [Cantharellus anzutake]
MAGGHIQLASLRTGANRLWLAFTTSYTLLGLYIQAVRFLSIGHACVLPAAILIFLTFRRSYSSLLCSYLRQSFGAKCSG